MNIVLNDIDALIKNASRERSTIVCANDEIVGEVCVHALALGCKIVKPVTFSTALKHQSNKANLAILDVGAFVKQVLGTPSISCLSAAGAEVVNYSTVEYLSDLEKRKLRNKGLWHTTLDSEQKIHVHSMPPTFDHLENCWKGSHEGASFVLRKSNVFVPVEKSGRIL